MADGKFAMKDGTEYLPKYTWTEGMNDDLAYSDRAGWTTSMEMLTGGVAHDWTDFGSLEVGNQYDLDAMGEERSMTTFAEGDGPMAKSHIGMMSMEDGAGMQDNANYSTLSGPGGKKVAMAPQNYNNVGKMSKNG